MESQATIAPIRKSVTVSCSRERAFEAFTQEIGRWWPVELHSVAREMSRDGTRAETVVFEGRPGGRLYEVTSDGREAKWADVLVWEPPDRLVLAWQPNPNSAAPTEVEVTFTASQAGTRVDLEHRGWERLGDRAVEARDGYNDWEAILRLFAAAAT